MKTILKKILSVFSRKERIIFFAAFVLAASSLIGLTADFIKQKTVIVPASGGSYVEGMLSQPANVNPVTASTEADKSLVKLFFGNLADLSDKITASKTGQEWEIRLKENIRWSDGEKLTSDDVIFTIQKIQDPDSNSPLYSNWRGVAVKRVSELEFQITLGSSYVFFPKNIEGLYPIPKHLFAETPVSNWRLSRYNLQPIGSGPYVPDSYGVRDDGFVTNYQLKPNKFYFASKALITDFGLKFFSNIDDLIEAFNSGQIDGLAMNSSRIKDIKRPYERHIFLAPSYYAVFFNQGQNLALQDKKVRQALSTAVNRGEILSTVLNDDGEPRLGPVSPSLLENYQYVDNTVSENPSLILEKNGWLISSSTVREKNINRTKVKLEFNLAVPQIPFIMKTAEKLQAYWAGIGAKINIIPISSEEISSNILKNRDYQAILFGNMPNPPGDFFAFWHSSQRFYPGLNLSLYNNKQADNLISKINQDTDVSKRALDTKNLENMIENDYPAVFLYSPYYAYFSRKDLQGIGSGLIGEPAERFNGINNWYLKTARSLK